MNTQTTLNQYEFSTTRFVPGYNDWDADFVTIEAENEESAIKQFRSLGWITKGWSVTKVETTNTDDQ